MFSNKLKPAAAVLLALLVFGPGLGTDVLLYETSAAQGTPDGTVERNKGKDDQAAQAKTVKPSKNLITGVVDGEEEEKTKPPERLHYQEGGLRQAVESVAARRQGSGGRFQELPGCRRNLQGRADQESRSDR